MDPVLEMMADIARARLVALVAAIIYHPDHLHRRKQQGRPGCSSHPRESATLIADWFSRAGAGWDDTDLGDSPKDCGFSWPSMGDVRCGWKGGADSSTGARSPPLMPGPTTNANN